MNAKFYRDSFIILSSLFATILIVKFGWLHNFLLIIKDYNFIASFIAGIFFISFFTVAPASAILFEIFKTQSLLLTAFFAALGAMAGDYIIFSIIRDSLSNYFLYLFKKIIFISKHPFFKWKIFKIFRWLTPLLGAVIIASPLPDEIGLTLMGLSKIKINWFLPIVFLLNFLGILIIGLIIKEFI